MTTEKEKEVSEEDQYDSAFDEGVGAVVKDSPPPVAVAEGSDQEEETTITPIEQKLADLMKQRETELALFENRIKELEDRLQAKAGTAEPVTESLPEEVSDYFSLYEGSRPAIEYLIGKAVEKVTMDAGNSSQLQFDLNVMSGCVDEKGNWLDGHPDVYKVVNSQEWKDKVKQNPKLMDTTDPREAIRIISRFKDDVISQGLKARDSKHRDATITKIKSIEGTISSGASSGDTARKTPRAITIQDQYDEFDHAFDEK